MKRAELKPIDGRFIIEYSGEVITNTSNRSNAIKNFTTSKKILQLGLDELYENDKLIFPKNPTEKQVKTQKIPKPRTNQFSHIPAKIPKIKNIKNEKANQEIKDAMNHQVRENLKSIPEIIIGGKKYCQYIDNGVVRFQVV